MVPDAPPSTLPKRWGLVMGLYLLGIFMGAIDTGIVTPGRTVIQRDLGVDDQLGIWMITIYTLAYAASIPVMGKLADRLGRKPVYLTSIALFGIGSLLCGLSQDVGSFEMLLAARALQAVGGGGILPIATAEIGTSVPPEKRGMALGLVGAVYGIANIFGASAGSLILGIVGVDNWQWIFYVNVPIAVAIVAAGVVVLPDHRVGESKSIDILGTFLLVAMILSLLYGVKGIDFFDFGASLRDVGVWPFLLGFVVALPLFVLAERRASDPVMNLGYFTDRGVGLVLLLSLLSGFILMAVVFVPQFAENALRVETGAGGYFVIVLGLASGIGAPLSGRLTDRFGPKSVLAVGFAASLLAAAAVTFWAIPLPGYPSVLSSLFLFGLGLGFIVGSPLNYMMLERTKPAEANSALSTLSLVRALGTTLAPAVMVGFLAQSGVLLQDRLTDQLPTSVPAPALPHAEELTKRFAEMKADDRIADQLEGVVLPDLGSRDTIEIDPSGGGSLPDDLVELLRTADVTNITARTKVVAERMFAAETPERVADIQSGVTTGIEGIDQGRRELKSTDAKMGDSLAEMDASLKKMTSSLATMTSNLTSMDASIAKMGRGIAGLDQAIAGMKSGVAGLTKAIAGMDTGMAKMTRGVTGLDSAITGMKSGVGGLDQAISGMDAGLADQRAALAGLSAAPPNPVTAAQIEQLEAAIDALEDERDAAASERRALKKKLSTAQAERAALVQARSELKARRDTAASQRRVLQQKLATAQADRAKLVKARNGLQTGRRELAGARAKLTSARAELTEARDELADARTEVGDAREVLDDTRAKMVELRVAVPGAFDEALATYLAEVDARGPKLESTFQKTLNEGFAGVFALYAAACLLSLAVLPLIPRVKGEPGVDAEPDPGP